MRAARVRVLDEQFHYFCSPSCAQAYAPVAPRDTRPEADSAALVSTPTAGRAAPANDSCPTEADSHDDSDGSNDGDAKSSVEPDLTVPHREEEVGLHSAPQELAIPVEAEPLTGDGASSAATPARPVALAVAIGSAMLSLLMLLALEGRVTDGLRLAFVGTALAALLGYIAQRYPRRTRTLVRIPPPVPPGGMTVMSVGVGVAAALLSAVTFALQAEQTSAVLSFAGAQLATIGAMLLADERLAAPLEHARQHISQGLNHSILRVTGQHSERIPMVELRPGEEVVIHAGETIPVDASVSAGSGEVNPWLHSDTVRRVGPGDFVYAGARVVSGQLRAVVRWTGNDRHWMRLTNDPARRADRYAPGVRVARRFALRAAPVAMLFALVTSLAQDLPWPTALAYVLAAAGVFLNPAMVRLIELDALRTTLKALANGIVVRSAATLDTAGKVSAAVFCARGTLLLGEPQLSTLETLGPLSEEEILALVSGAEQAANHPIASSVLRAARERGVTPDAVRSPRSEAGLGVTALASDGRKLVVGSRGLMLRERVSVARAEHRITELEASGRTVLLVALGGHLSGILALQDGLRAGARAAVQHLLDAGIEPIMLSGDARDTCEALARTIDIDHIRPEVLPAERGAEVERLRAGGGAVAVVGRSPVDDLALASASVSLALPSQVSQAGGFDIELAGDEVQKAALALRLLHQHRSYAQRVLILVGGGGALATLASLALALPAGWVPLVMLGFGASALLSSSNADAKPVLPAS